jgi:cell division initiation protein
MDANAIRDIQFREKLRGYHPEDVDTFVARVAETVESLQRRVDAAEAQLADVQSQSSEAANHEDSLRRTLVLAQRTADLAVQEAREEAARLLADAHAQHDSLVAEVEAHKATLREDAEAEIRDERERLYEQRAALLADVEALEHHLARERERLRIYFSDQLRRVEQGEPSAAAPPPMTAADAPPPEPTVDDDEDDDVEDDREGIEAAGDPGSSDDDDADASAEEEEDPFLAELRRAVTDERPLGPRDDAPSDDDGAAGADDGFDLFAQGGDEGGRFGSRLRRRR